jgi:hypothetical protein
VPAAPKDTRIASVLQHPLLEHLGAQVGGVHLLGAGHRPVVTGLGVRLPERRLLLRRGRHGAGDVLGHRAQLHRLLLHLLHGLLRDRHRRREAPPERCMQARSLLRQRVVFSLPEQIKGQC